MDKFVKFSYIKRFPLPSYECELDNNNEKRKFIKDIYAEGEIMNQKEMVILIKETSIKYVSILYKFKENNTYIWYIITEDNYVWICNNDGFWKDMMIHIGRRDLTDVSDDKKKEKEIAMIM